MSGYWSLHANLLLFKSSAKWTCPNDAAAEACLSKFLNFDVQSSPNSALIRLFTNNHPIEGASAWRWANSFAYSLGTASGIVDNIWAIFIIGPLIPPRASLNCFAWFSLSILSPKYFSPANLAASPPTAEVTLAYLLILPAVNEPSNLSSKLLVMNYKVSNSSIIFVIELTPLAQKLLS